MKKLIFFILCLSLAVLAGEPKDFTIEWFKFQILNENLEEVGLAGIWVKNFSAPLPEQYSVYWTEWMPEESQAKQLNKPEIVKRRRIQRFETFAEAEKFFIAKVQERLAVFKKDVIQTKK